MKLETNKNMFLQRIQKLEMNISGIDQMVSNLNKAFKLQNDFQSEWENQFEEIKSANLQVMAKMIEKSENQVEAKIEEKLQDVLFKKRFDEKM